MLLVGFAAIAVAPEDWVLGFLLLCCADGLVLVVINSALRRNAIDALPAGERTRERSPLFVTVVALLWGGLDAIVLG